LKFPDVCNFRALCLAILDKCQVHEKLTWWDGQKVLPRNIVPRFKKGWPTKQYAEWYGVDYTKLSPYVKKVEVTDPETLIREWDGCSHISESIVPILDVPGLGVVSQVR